MIGPMRTEGPRADLVAKLHELAEGWWHLGKDQLADASRAGAERLQGGDTSIQVGHTEYVVTDEA
jgi:hypothetical protein